MQKTKEWSEVKGSLNLTTAQGELLDLRKAPRKTIGMPSPKPPTAPKNSPNEHKSPAKVSKRKNVTETPARQGGIRPLPRKAVKTPASIKSESEREEAVRFERARLALKRGSGNRGRRIMDMGRGGEHGSRWSFFVVKN